ncbi:MAG TPA: hypothetical protein VHY31_02610 [Streptosporangiaceae bacterium]|jgi:hypothetical protein|nr:hypothetical protein [Streptosporangiaceae bacterium]
MQNQGQEPERGSWADPLHPKRAWFGPKRYGGIGYGPRTWEGYLVTAVLAAAVIVTATTTKGQHPGLVLLAVIPVVVIPLAIMAVQRHWLGRR